MRDAYTHRPPLKQKLTMSNINERLQRRIFGAFASLVGGITNNFAQTEQNKLNREFQAEENQKDRDFNAEQAQLSRDWQERMYNDYESPQAQVNQRLAAGLNPSEGVTSQSVGNSSTASSSSSPLPPGKAPSANFLAEMPIFVEQLKKARAEANLADTQAEDASLDLRKKKEAYDSGHNEYIDDSVLKTSQKMLNESIAELNDTQRGNLFLQREQIVADTLLKESQRILADLETNMKIDRYPLEYQVLAYSASLGATTSQDAAIKAEINRLWHSPEWKDTGRLVLDFIHHNLNLSGGGNVSKIVK